MKYLNLSKLKKVSTLTSTAKAFILISSILTSSIAESGGNLGDSLNKLGIMSNFNKPEVVHDQLGGYMSGGSMHTRAPASDIGLFNIQLPSLNMGCGGIDFFMGGIGYVDTEKLKKLIDNIGSAAMAYGSMLAVKTISPQIADVLSQLEAMARFINSQNINSCQLGASIAAGLTPKSTAAQELACSARKLGSRDGGSIAGSFFTAKYDCSNEDITEINKEEYKGMLGTEFNLVWHALKKSDKQINPDEMEELMSISGTLISTPTGNGSVKFSHKTSLLKDEKILEKLVYGVGGGGNTQALKRYFCNDKEKCIDVVTKTQNVAKDDGYIVKIKKLVSSISEKFLLEEGGSMTSLTSDEQHLVETSSIPILKIITLENAMKGNNVSLAIEEYAEIITFDYLISYLDNMLDTVYRAVANLEYNQVDGEQIKNFKEEIRHIKSYLFNERQGTFARMSTLLSVKQRIMQQENMVKAAFYEFRSN